MEHINIKILNNIAKLEKQEFKNKFIYDIFNLKTQDELNNIVDIIYLELKSELNKKIPNERLNTSHHKITSIFIKCLPVLFEQTTILKYLDNKEALFYDLSFFGQIPSNSIEDFIIYFWQDYNYKLKKEDIKYITKCFFYLITYMKVLLEFKKINEELVLNKGKKIKMEVFLQMLEDNKIDEDIEKIINKKFDPLDSLIKEEFYLMSTLI